MLPRDRVAAGSTRPSKSVGDFLICVVVAVVILADFVVLIPPVRIVFRCIMLYCTFPDGWGRAGTDGRDGSRIDGLR